MKHLERLNSNIHYLQSAVIPFRIKKKRIKILLITSLKTKQWIFPKGIIEEHLTPQQSALQEAAEEAGVEGKVLNIILGEYSYVKWGGTCVVTVFPMYVTKVMNDWPEADQRKRLWVSIDEAAHLINKKKLHQSLNKFEEKREKILLAITKIIKSNQV
jgi:8-oxo-dGTP pyrophosphatase MutT (NUDIX family)